MNEKKEPVFDSFSDGDDQRISVVAYYSVFLLMEELLSLRENSPVENFLPQEGTQEEFKAASLISAALLKLIDTIATSLVGSNKMMAVLVTESGVFEEAFILELSYHVRTTFDYRFFVSKLAEELYNIASAIFISTPRLQIVTGLGKSVYLQVKKES